MKKEMKNLIIIILYQSTFTHPIKKKRYSVLEMIAAMGKAAKKEIPYKVQFI